MLQHERLQLTLARARVERCLANADDASALAVDALDWLTKRTRRAIGEHAELQTYRADLIRFVDAHSDILGRAPAGGHDVLTLRHDLACFALDRPDHRGGQKKKHPELLYFWDRDCTDFPNTAQDRRVRKVAKEYLMTKVFGAERWAAMSSREQVRHENDLCTDLRRYVKRRAENSGGAKKQRVR